MNREERRLSNAKQNKIGVVGFYPSKMEDGQILFALPKNKYLRFYKKLKGFKWWMNLTRDGNQHIDKSLFVKERILINDKTAFDSNGYQQSGAKTIQTLLFGHSVEISAGGGATTTEDAEMAGGAENTQGYRMLHAGKVTGISIQAICTDDSGEGTLKATVQKNGVNQSMNVFDAEGAGNVGGISTSNSFSFSANERINVELEVLETSSMAPIAFSNIAVVVEIKT